MKNELIPFSFENTPVRMTVIDGQEWWVGKDVCDALELANSRDAVRRLENYEKKMSVIPTSSTGQSGWLVNESGIYSLALTSRTDRAKAFKKWLTTEVIPQIRKTGGYRPDAILDGWIGLQYLDEENKKLKREIRRHENRSFLTAGDRIDILTLYVKKYPISAIQKITKKGRARIKKFLDEILELPDDERDAEIEAWYKAEEGKGGRHEV